MKIKKLYLASLFVVSIGMFVSVLLFAPKTSAATFVVDSVADDSDLTPGDGNCDIGSGECTFRAAIEEVNNLAGDDTIHFSIGGVGPHIIAPLSDLPTVTEAVTVDASTQPGASCGDLVPDSLPVLSNTRHNLSVELDGSSIPTQDGVSISAGFAENGSVMIRGISIVNFNSSAAIRADSGSGGLLLDVECSYLGVHSDGLTSGANLYGVQIGSVNTQITNSLVSGNSLGIYAENNTMTVVSSLIGVNETGVSELSNAGYGISMQEGQLDLTNSIVAGNQGHGIEGSNASLSATGNYIGLGLNGSAIGNGLSGVEFRGASQFDVDGTSGRNVISANGGDGIHLFSECNGIGVNSGSIVGNYIGTNVNGEVEPGYGNTGNGIRINEFSGFCGTVKDVTVGGVSAGEENIIAGNAENGIVVYQSNAADVFSISMIRNSIFANGGLGIELAHDNDDDGIAETDIGPNPINSLLISYPATKANYYLNSPVIHSATSTGNELDVTYSYQAQNVQNSSPEIDAEDVVGYRLDFYASDGSSMGQGKTHIGSFIVDGSETNATHTFTNNVNTEYGVTATATILWKVIPNPCPIQSRHGNGPPYTEGNCE